MSRSDPLQFILKSNQWRDVKGGLLLEIKAQFSNNYFIDHFVITYEHFKWGKRLQQTSGITELIRPEK